MEAILLGDDSSSGESDSEVVTTVANVSAHLAAPQPQQADNIPKPTATSPTLHNQQHQQHQQKRQQPEVKHSSQRQPGLVPQQQQQQQTLSQTQMQTRRIVQPAISHRYPPPHHLHHHHRLTATPSQRVSTTSTHQQPNPSWQTGHSQQRQQPPQFQPQPQLQLQSQPQAPPQPQSQSQSQLQPQQQQGHNHHPQQHHQQPQQQQQQQQKPQQQHQQQVHQAVTSSHYTSSSGCSIEPIPFSYSHHSSSTNPTTLRDMCQRSGSVQSLGASSSSGLSHEQQQIKREEQLFILFLNVLMQYLKYKNPAMTEKVKEIIRDCVEKKKRRILGYENATNTMFCMRKRLRVQVGEKYWKETVQRFNNLLKQHAKLANEQRRRQASQQQQTSSMQPHRQHSRTIPTRHQHHTLSSSTTQKATATTQQAFDPYKQRQPPQQQPVITNSRTMTISTTSFPTTNYATSGGVDVSGAAAVLPNNSVGSAAMSAVTSTAYNKKIEPSSSKNGQSKNGQSKNGQCTSSLTRVVEKGLIIDSNQNNQKEPPWEYTEIMQMVDHAVDYDWTMAGLLLGNQSQQQFNQEQRNLLNTESKPKYANKPPSHAKDAANDTNTTTVATKLSKHTQGWGMSNIVTARVAWARIRLREQRQQRKQLQQQSQQQNETPTTTSSTSSSSSSSWVNEEDAEQDVTLALLSEATQMYLKSVLEKALHCARQRQNSGGVRLWNQQCIVRASDQSFSDNKKKTTNATKSNKKNDKCKNNNNNIPPLSLRVGCDVYRQVHRSQGNAALTCKRMEITLKRQPQQSPTKPFQQENVVEASSMSELSLRPKLRNGVKDADETSKRNFELFGGNDAGDDFYHSPFQPIPKKSKLVVSDIEMGMNL